MKKDRKRRKEAIKRLEKLEDMNRAGEEVNSLDLIGALYPKFVFEMWRDRRDKQACAELLEGIKSLVDIKDYITCPRSKEGRAIHIGDKVYKVDGDGEPLIVEEINISRFGSMIECKNLDGKWLSYRPQRLTFDDPREIIVTLRDMKQEIYIIHKKED